MRNTQASLKGIWREKRLSSLTQTGLKPTQALPVSTWADRYLIPHLYGLAVRDLVAVFLVCGLCLLIQSKPKALSRPSKMIVLLNSSPCFSQTVDSFHLCVTQIQGVADPDSWAKLQPRHLNHSLTLDLEWLSKARLTLGIIVLQLFVFWPTGKKGWAFGQSQETSSYNRSHSSIAICVWVTLGRLSKIFLRYAA